MTRSAEDYLKQGNEFFKKGEFEKAIVHYTEAIRFNRDYASAYYNRSKAYEKKGDYEKAREDYDQAIYLNPDYAKEDSGGKKTNKSSKAEKIKEHFDRGQAYYYNDEIYDLALAIEELTKAIKLDPEAPDIAPIYGVRGYAYHDNGDYDWAISDFTKSMQICSDVFEKHDYLFSLMHLGRGTSYGAKGNFNMAIADFEATLRFDPNNSDAKNYLEKIRNKTGR